MNDNIIKIELSYFLDKYKNVESIPENIKNKVNELEKNYNCFNSLYDPKMIWVKKHFVKKEKNLQQRNKVHVIIPDFEHSSVLKRKLLGLLNKLTIVNKNNIYNKITQIIATEDNDKTFDIIWDYILLNDNILYSNILSFYDNTFIQNKINTKWNNYIQNKEWKPPAYIYDNNILYLKDDYDIYCEYIKWKKNIMNITTIWLRFKLDSIDFLLNDIYNYIIEIIKENIVYKHILDIFLEQVFLILSTHKNINIINNIKNIDINNFNNSTKFIIYNILDLENK